MFLWKFKVSLDDVFYCCFGIVLIFLPEKIRLSLMVGIGDHNHHLFDVFAFLSESDHCFVWAKGFQRLLEGSAWTCCWLNAAEW